MHGFLPRAGQRISDQTPLAPSPAAETVEVQEVLAKARFAAGLATMGVDQFTAGSSGVWNHPAIRGMPAGPESRLL